MGIDVISDSLALGSALNLGIKIFGVIGSFVYLAFTIVAIRQIRIMKDTVLVKDGGLLLLLGYIQIAIAIVLILYSFFL